MNAQDTYKQIASLSPEERALFELLLKKEGVDLSTLLVAQQRDGNTAPLSFAQQRLWFLDQMEPGRATYNVPVSIRLSGRLNVDALGQSIDEIVRRHEVLRTTFATEDGQPVQVIAPAARVEVKWITLEDIPDAEKDSHIFRLATEHAQRPFDLTAGPLVQTALLRVAEEEHVLLITLHHVAADGWSTGIFIRELAALYEAFSFGKPSPLAEPAVQYADFAMWQRLWLQGGALETQLAYWRRQLSGATGILDLPTDRSRPAVQTYAGSRYSFALSKELADEVDATSRREGVTVFMLLLAAFKALLYRYTGQQDVIVGSPVAGRSRAEIEGLIGFFVNTLVLRTDFSNNPRFRGLLQRVREVCLAAYAHQDLPFEKLIEELQPQRDLSHKPLFQVMFALLNAPMPDVNLPGLTLSLLEIDSETAKFDLSLELVESKQQFTGWLEYNTDLFDAATIQRLASHFHTLLESLIEDPNRPVSLARLLTGGEREQLLVEWNRTDKQYERSKLVHELIEEQAATRGDSIAVVYEGRQVSYREVNRRANQIGRYLRGKGVREDERVGVCLRRSEEMVIAMMGVMKAGCGYVPVDPDYPQERLSWIIKNAQVRLILTESEPEMTLPSGPVSTIAIDKQIEEIKRCSGANLGIRIEPGNLAYVIFTSGSTGTPKGVMNTHGAILNRLQWMQDAYGLGPSDSVLQKTPFTFDVSVWEFFWPLMTGARLVVARPAGHQDSAYLARLIAEENISTMHFVPSMLQVFLAEEALGECACLKRVISSGEALSLELQNKFYARLCAELHNLYGPTEAAIDVTFWACERESRRRYVPIGNPIANIKTYVLDAQLGPTPIGVPGELHIGGVGLARGYFNDPALSAEKFIPDSFSDRPGARLYRTGDVARYHADSSIEFLGRNDHQVKVRGFRIDPSEIEAALNQNDAIKESVVTLEESTPGHKQLTAYVVASDGRLPNLTELRNYLKQKLPEYMTPSAFVLLEALPLTPNGKLDRGALAAHKATRLKAETTFVAPRNEAEETLAGIWAEVLKVDRVGVFDNFFELGGDSILSIQIVARATQLGLRLTTMELFLHQTVAELAASATPRAALEPGRDSDAPLLEDGARQALERLGDVEDAYPLSPMQHGMLFHTLHDLEPDTYTIQMSCSIHAKLDAQAFRRAWREVVARHASLRSAFIWEGLNEPLQVVRSRVELPWEEDDWRNLTAEAQAERLASLLASDRARGFELSLPPLMRLLLIRTGDESWRLIWTQHHMLLDGWSLSLVLREVFELYEAFAEGREARLDRQPPYRDYIAWLRRQDLSRAESFWRSLLAGFAAPTTLGVDRPVGAAAVGERAYSQQQVYLGGDASTALGLFARKHQLTLNTVAQGAWALLLMRYSGEKDVVFGATASGRPADLPGVESIVGLFINTLPVRAQASADARVVSWLRQLQQQQFEARQYEYVSLAQVQAWSEVPRRRPLFESLLVFENYPVDQFVLEKSGGLGVAEIQSYSFSNYPLELLVAPGSNLFLQIKYDRRRFDEAVVARMLEHLQAILEAIVAGPEGLVSTLSSLTSAEGAEILEGFDDDLDEI
jgi:amino acid adenylation domain-containing protein